MPFCHLVYSAACAKCGGPSERFPRHVRLRKWAATPERCCVCGQVGLGRDGGGVEAAPGSAGAEREFELTDHEGASLLQRQRQAGGGAGGKPPPVGEL